MIDNLGGRLGSFDRLEKELAPGAALVGLRPRARRAAPTSAAGEAPAVPPAAAADAA